MTTQQRFLRTVVLLALAVIILSFGILMEFFLLFLSTVTYGVFYYFNRPASRISLLEKLFIASIATSWIIALGQLAKNVYPFFF